MFRGSREESDHRFGGSAPFFCLRALSDIVRAEIKTEYFKHPAAATDSKRTNCGWMILMDLNAHRNCGRFEFYFRPGRYSKRTLFRCRLVNLFHRIRQKKFYLSIRTIFGAKIFTNSLHIFFYSLRVSLKFSTCQ